MFKAIKTMMGLGSMTETGDADKPVYEPDTYMDQPREGLVRQERITYEVVDGVYRRRKTTRVYLNDVNDGYQDSYETVVLGDRRGCSSPIQTQIPKTET